MGGKDSKPAYIIYEEAFKRVSETDVKRLKDAFKRSSTLNGYMTKAIFIKEVLGENVPSRLAEQMYRAFGGSVKGLAFKDLFCGLVLLTAGCQEEKVKFLFGLYATEDLSHVQKEEMDRLVLATEGQVPDCLNQLFLHSDRVTYDEFREWLMHHPGATSVTRWLLQDPCMVRLSDNTEMPTFYQTLAGVTHLEENDIIELEKRYWSLKGQSKTGKFDLETFKPIVSPPIPPALCEGIFNAFDENRDNHIDFKEMACGISACCRGPQTERQKFCFKIFDLDHDGLLNKSELIAMIEAMLGVRLKNKSPDELMSDNLHNVTAESLAENILTKYDSNKDGCITQEEYLVWTVDHALPSVFLDLLFQVCHVVLGLKPQNKDDEGLVISGWLEREERLGLHSGQVWYLISMTWWRQWLSYVNYLPAFGPYQDDPLTTKSQMSSSKAAQLYRNLARKSSFGSNDNGTVIGTSFTSYLQSDSPNSPQKFSQVSRSSHTPQSSPRHSSSTQLNDNPSLSLPLNQSSPAPSPRMSKHLMSMPASRPGAIDNNALIYPNTSKIPLLTNEGGRLKRDRMLTRGRDFELIPESVWKALSSWYGGAPSLPRTVITPSNGDSLPELELYPILTRLLRHQQPPRTANTNTSFTGMIGGMGGMAVTTSAITNHQPQIPRRYLAYNASFSRKHTLRQVYEFLANRLRISKEDIRLWKVKDDQPMTFLDDDDQTVEAVGIEDNMQILIEVRNKDLTWPEEMSQIAKNRQLIDKKNQVPSDPGVTGLNNLGNTCFMNSALQCVSNTRILTLYFNGGMHLYELNRNNPLGMKGHIAQRYGELVKDLWSGTAKSLAPLKFRWTIGKYAPRFNGFQQHDSQELLAFLLDGLHEDLNRVHKKPYVELKDSDGRPDEVVAKEAWENHLIRNKSIIVDLFHGQLKSCVRCLECGHTSVRFDPFTYLSLPLPMDSCIHVEVTVIKLNGAMPVRYGLRLSMDEKYKNFKKTLGDLCKVPATQLLLAEIGGAVIKTFPSDNGKVKSMLGGTLYAYELPPIEDVPDVSLQDELEVKKLNGHFSEDLSQIQRLHNTRPNNNNNNANVTNNNSQSAEAVRNGNNNIQHTNSSSSLSDSGAESSNSPSHHQRQASNGNFSTTSSANGSSVSAITTGINGSIPDSLAGFIVAMHRKMMRMDSYFLASQKSRPSLFGTPLVLPCDAQTTQKNLYQLVWMQVSRLVSPLPPSENGKPNHAQDCDDSLGYEYPFQLKFVQKDGSTCALCPWYRFCRGCPIECSSDFFRFASSFVAIDWEPTALHLRYQTTQERSYAEHVSVEDSRKQQTEPIDLDACLKAFTKEEELGEDELYYCSKCKKHRLAAKKLDIWRLPPILIIHLKRFQFLNNRWVKSQKIVKFPFQDFDPANYLVPRLPLDLVNGDASVCGNRLIKPIMNGAAVTLSNGDDDDVFHKTPESSPRPKAPLSNGSAKPNGSIQNSHQRQNNGLVTRQQPTSDVSKPVIPNHDKIEIAMDALETKEHDALSRLRKQHRSLTSEYHEDYTDVKYNLFSLSSHTGILGGGHYVAYAKNPNKKWYIYNDSSCKDIPETSVDTDSAYMLFYERANLDYGKFMPDVTNREPDTSDIDDEFESDIKKMCSLQ